MAASPIRLLPLYAGALLLAAAPAVWLWRSWQQPLYNPGGLWIALAVAALFVWSLSSRRVDDADDAGGRRLALWLLLTTALVRLAGQLLGVNVIGALALAIDVYALALLAGLAGRARALSPFWLAVLFAFSLPLERALQRVAGYWLQQLSADGACRLLQGFGEARCQGLRILWGGREVLVDLPCSGAGGLTLLLSFCCFLACVYRPRPAAAVAALVFSVLLAYTGNVSRIVLISVAYGYDIDVLASPWHELIGLTTLAVSALPLLWWFTRPDTAAPQRGDDPAVPRPTPACRAVSARPAFGLGFFGLAVLIVWLPASPPDVSKPLAPIALPAGLLGYPARPGELNPRERVYFTRYGGVAARAAYGPFSLLLVSTSAPLRHLHGPDECLTGAGYTVRYRGLRDDDGLPSSIYHADDRDGRRWRVAVTYVSDRGEVAAHVAEAVWRWLRAPGSTWTMVQRVGPAGLPAGELLAWDRAVRRALELPPLAAKPLFASQE